MLNEEEETKEKNPFISDNDTIIQPEDTCDDDKVDYSQYLANISSKINEFLENFPHANESNDYETIDQLALNVFSSIDTENYPPVPSHIEEPTQVVAFLLSFIGENIHTDESSDPLFSAKADLIKKMLQLIQKLSFFDPLILDKEQFPEFLHVMQECFGVENEEFNNLVVETIAAVVDDTKGSAKEMKPLYAMIMDRMNESDLVSNFARLKAIKAFVKQLSKTGDLAMEPLLMCICEHMKIGENEEGDSCFSTIYATEILAEIVLSNYPGTNALMMKYQPFIFLTSMLSRKSDAILRPVLDAIQYAVTTLKCANVLVTDVDTPLIIEMLDREGVSKEASLCLSAILERRLEEQCDMDVKAVFEKAIQSLDGAPLAPKQALIHLIRCIAENASNEELASMPIAVLGTTTANIMEMGDDLVSAEILTAFSAIYIKLRVKAVPTEMVQAFIDNDGMNLLQESTESDFDELNEIAEQVSSLIQQDIPE